MNDEYLIYGETLTAIANSIRSISSVSTTWTPDEMAAYILANLVKPTTRQAAKTYTPSTSNQTIPAGTFLTGAATIQGDADWTESNIKKGVNMWGKTGTLDGIFGTPGTFYGFTKVKSGSFTKTSTQSYFSQTVTHGLGVIPRLIMYYTATPQQDHNSIMAGVMFATGGITTFKSTAPSGEFGFMQQIRHYTSGSATLGFAGPYTNSSYYKAPVNPFTSTASSTDNSHGGWIIGVTASSFTIKARDAESDGGIDFIKGATYKWIAMA